GRADDPPPDRGGAGQAGDRPAAPVRRRLHQPAGGDARSGRHPGLRSRLGLGAPSCYLGGAMSTETKGPPLYGLPFGGVFFGALWILGAFITLFACFVGNYLNKPVAPATELAIANAALAPAETAEHRPAPPAAQP